MGPYRHQFHCSRLSGRSEELGAEEEVAEDGSFPGSGRSPPGLAFTGAASMPRQHAP